jgi:TolB-like protein/Tfp pilus assembly protein PilF
MSFIAELRRRNVIRVAGLYLVGAWLVVQVAETLLPVFGAPDWVLRVLVVLLALGFVPTLIASWVFELTPDGIKRDQDVDHSQIRVHQTARKLDAAVIVLLLAVGAMVLFKPSLQPASSPPSAEGEVSDAAADPSAISASAAATSEASIAVLPFADLSQTADQGYFSDGMSEEILNVLAKVKGLQVASRTSSFAFKGQENLGIPAIAQQLGVRHVLEGSVRRAGGTIRITAQLIDADVDRHLWSETFDRPLTAENVFAIQDEISQAIVAALVEAMPSANLGDVGDTTTTTNLSAYDSYLQARPLVRSRRQLLLADHLLEQSLQQDPQFVPAWELRAGLQALLGEYTDTPLTLEELTRRAYEFADKALSLAPDSAMALAVKANMRSRDAQQLRGRHDLGEIIADFERSLALEPNNADALNWLGMTWLLVGQTEKALGVFQRCMQVDPMASACTENEYDTLHSLGRHDEAWQHYLAAFDHGAITDQYTNFGLLAHFEQKSAFMFASNQSNYLPRWRRHEALYEAFRQPDADHGELVRDVLAFAARENVDVGNGYVGLILVPLGAWDLVPQMMGVWNREHQSYRQSAQFKRVMRESGAYAYWRKKGFPRQCQSIGQDDFRCD